MRKGTALARLALVALPALLLSTQSGAQSPAPPSVEAVAAEIESLRKDYEARLQALESQLAVLKAGQRQPGDPAQGAKPAQDNAFNPAIGVVFDGRYADFSSEDSAIPGFRGGHESERAPQGLSLGHSEVTVSGNIDDKFRGNLTLGLGAHPGEATEVELEEAYVATTAGSGLPEGLRIKAGRALWTFGYLNELHAHGDDFADRPLPYRAFSRQCVQRRRRGGILRPADGALQRDRRRPVPGRRYALRTAPTTGLGRAPPMPGSAATSAATPPGASAPIFSTAGRTAAGRTATATATRTTMPAKSTTRTSTKRTTRSMKTSMRRSTGTSTMTSTRRSSPKGRSRATPGSTASTSASPWPPPAMRGRAS